MDIPKVLIFLLILILLYLLIDSYSSTSQSAINVEISDINRSEPRISSDNMTETSNKSSVTVRSTMNNLNSNIEHFRANGIDNPVIDQGAWDNSYTKLNPPLSAGGKDTMSQRLIVHQISDKEFIALITEIKAYIANTIIDQAQTCQAMHGDEVKLHDGKRGLTLACVTDPYALEKQIIDGVYEMIYQFVKSRFNINMNPYLVYHDLHMHMGLMERIIYPLQFSGLYTVHGVQYTNKDWIRTKVHDNLDIRNVLFTVLSRRNIEIEVDTDQQVH